MSTYNYNNSQQGSGVAVQNNGFGTSPRTNSKNQTPPPIPKKPNYSNGGMNVEYQSSVSSPTLTTNTSFTNNTPSTNKPSSFSTGSYTTTTSNNSGSYGSNSSNNVANNNNNGNNKSKQSFWAKASRKVTDAVGITKKK